MSDAATLAPPAARPRFYYGWVNLVLAAVAMTATLPGRTHGLGLITKPLTEDAGLGVGAGLFSVFNFWAILLGSALCLPVGWLIDRLGTRLVLTAVAAGLGAAVLWMSAAGGAVALFLALVLVRGLGQGSLSVVSMAMIGKWFRRRLGVAMGLFTVLLSVGFIVPVLVVGQAVADHGWRAAWAGVGVAVLGLAPLGWLLTRSTPESIGQEPDPPALQPEGPALLDLSLGAALCSPAFWAFTLAASLFNLVWSAITLFNESLLADQELGHDTFLIVMGALVFTGLPANLISGWLLGRLPVGRVLLPGMVLLAGCLAAFPQVHSSAAAVAYGAAMGVAGGVITVVWFGFYGQAFGRARLGAIQGTAQIVSVFASALGPVLLTACKDRLGSVTPLFYASAGAAVVLGVVAWLTPLPRRACLESVGRG
jgi:MFS family permease